jgi:hypothetical protein
MAKLLGFLISLTAGGVAGWQVWLNLADVIDDRYVPMGIGGGAGLVVTLLLYFLLARPIAGVISDRLSALHTRVKSTRAGTGLDEVPLRPRTAPSPKPDTCRICGAPGGPVCPACQAEMDRG